MSNVIQFLESLGSNPALGRLSAAGYAAAVVALETGNAERQALLDRNHSALNELLDGRAQMFFMVATPDNRPPSDMPDDQNDGDAPDTDGDPDHIRRAV